ncbi:MAG: glycosyltransferase [Planctomycetota bacterium]|jgi:glycosyltransferase involved in cell wall biosynthesis
MIEGQTILCFASGYDAPPTSKHHVMHLLAERNVVLWVNYHASRTPTVSSSDLAYMARKLAQVFAGLKHPRENLYVLTPLVVPLPSSPWARKLNEALLAFQIRWALGKILHGPVQFWSFTPDVSYLLGRFGEKKVVYYCVDDHASFTGHNRRQVLRDEEDLCRRADLVVTTSTVLQQAKEPLNPNTMLVPHGVDYAHFARALSNHRPAPSDVADIPHPRLGFFGLIRDWVNLDLLAEVARRRPDWHIMLIGDSTLDLAPYRSLENMHFLGRKPYEVLPDYCREFDVGLIPFKINELTRAVNPIKLREYLAAGLPVVSTPLPEVELYGHLVETAATADEFTTAATRCLDGDPADRTRRATAMAAESWLARVSDVCSRLSGNCSKPKDRQLFETERHEDHLTCSNTCVSQQPTKNEGIQHGIAKA